MFIELVDSLRCVEAHEDTWLVASVSRMDGRHIVTGLLGCPVCRREYPVRDGIAWFVDRDDPGNRSLTPAPDGTDPELVPRAAALLGLTDAGGIVVLGGHWVACANPIAELGAAHVVILDAVPPSPSAQEVSAVAVGHGLPFAAGSVRGIALGGTAATPRRIESAARVLRPRGRLIAPTSAEQPAEVTELARDAADWVAERGAASSPPIPLRSARR
jgi:uncharacterized protein YbaR (Trm112 family)